MNLIKHGSQNRFLGDHWTPSFLGNVLSARNKSDRETAASATNLFSIFTKGVMEGGSRSPSSPPAVCRSACSAVNCVGRFLEGQGERNESSWPWGTDVYKFSLVPPLFPATTLTVLDKGEYSAVYFI